MTLRMNPVVFSGFDIHECNLVLEANCDLRVVTGLIFR